MATDMIELARKVEELKKRRRAVVLAHNYQLPEIQDVADFVGDSLELSMKAVEVDADVVVFAGVSFMAEMAAILNPDKIVLHPNPCASCPLADFLPPHKLREVKEVAKHAPIVLYVNSLAASKAESDYVVTSSSATRLISKLEDEEVVFGPDKNLADYVAQATGKRVIAAPPYGHCPVHEHLLNQYYVDRALERRPNALLIAHPETPRDVRAKARYIGSTSQMLEAISKFNGSILLATEEGLAYRARRMYPGRDIEPANPLAVCIDMKKITLRHVARSLELLKPRVVVEDSIAKKVREVLERSLELAR